MTDGTEETTGMVGIGNQTAQAEETDDGQATAGSGMRTRRFGKLHFTPKVAMVAMMVAVVAALVLLPEAKAGVIGTATVSDADIEQEAEVDFYKSSDISIEDAQRLVASDERMSEIGGQGDIDEGTYSDDYQAPPMPDANIGREIAWLAVQMAGIASDQSGSLYEPSAYPWNQIDDARLSNEFAIMDATLGAYGGNNAYASCNQAACGVIAAVADMDAIPFEAASGNPGYMQEYLRSRPDLYERVYPETRDGLMPGDILVTTDKFSHTAIWVGNEMAQTKFPGTSGNLYQAGYQEGDHARYPQIDCLSEDDYQWVGYDVYRVIRRNTESQYPTIDYREIIRQASGA